MQGFRYRPELMEGLPEELTKELKKYEDWFWLDPPKLKTISDHFAKELEKGLTVEGGSIPMNVTWIMRYPTGQEKGRILTVDLGGTNIRVCDVCLSAGKRDFEQRQRKYKLPEEVKTTTKDALWGFIADRIKSFLSESHNDTSASDSNPIPLAFTFSFPVEQKSIRSGILQRWTKNFNVSGVVGHDVVPQLEEELAKRNVPVKLVALINDTAGTLVASRYRDPQVKIGSIFSTGCNAAYMEECRLIPKLRDSGLPEDATVIINTEYGSFDNEREVLPLTPFDRQIDDESAHPGRQIYEKMVAGLYIGEMLRLVMLKMHEAGLLFKGQDVSRLRTANSLETSFLSTVEMDMSESLTDMKEEFMDSLNLELSLDELKACRLLIGLIAMRAARLYACGIAAICKKEKRSVSATAHRIAVLAGQSMLDAPGVRSHPLYHHTRPRHTSVGINTSRTIFDDTTYELESNSDAINIEVNISVLNRALRSAWGSTHTQLRLTKKDKTPLLALTVLASEWTEGNIALATNNDADGFGDDSNPEAPADTTGDRGPRERQTWITQEIPIKILHESAVEGLHEPHCPDPEVHIILPNLAQLKSISDRFTKLASTDSKSRQPGVMAPEAPGMHSVSFSGPGANTAATALSTNSSPKLELSANMHGSLRLAIATDELRIASVWSDLVNPPLDPAQMSQEQMSQLPSELNRKREASEGFESGWAKVRIDGKDWSRVLSIGRLSPKVVACFVNEMALVLYVYLPGNPNGEESCLTYYINSFTT
ncbi:Hexokinase N-terminal [Penicillium expansum]|nr:Hexokinase N-terminal [Penicillium expansum]